MLTLQTLLSLPVFLSTTLVAHALASPSPGGFIDSDNKGSAPPFAAVLTGGDGCNAEELEAIRDGFEEMTRLFRAALPVNWEGEAELEFFGRPDRISNYTAMIESNLRRAAQYGNLKGDATVNPDIHVRCDDPNGLCDEGNKREGKHVAYNIGNDPHINFCKRYFGLDALDDTVDKEAQNMTTNLELMNYYNRATAWARMVMHIAAVGTAIVERVVAGAISNSSAEWVTEKHEGAMNTSVLAGVKNEHPETDGPNDISTLKYAYGAMRAKLLGVLSTQEPYDAANNAENYALFAQARYVMEQKGFFPNLPVMDFGSDFHVLANEQLQEGERKRYAFFDMTDVCERRPGMEVIGAPLSSSASALHKTRTPWAGPSAFALSWAVACSITLLIIR